MTDTFLELVPVYGVWAIALTTFLSCLAVPVPSSLIMLAGGAFVASNDLTLWSVVAGAWGGAVLGDQTGYRFGAWGGGLLRRGLGHRSTTAKLLTQAQNLLDQRGFMAVFLSRWLFSPLGPYVNFLGGAGRMAWPHFTVGSFSGEAVWVAVYVSLGFAFSGQITAVADIAANFAGLLAGLALTAFLGRAMLRSRKKRKLHQSAKQ